jgi:glycosyltransferase involved in cell wall biosynthesis
VRGLVDEIVVVDTGSTDGTVDVARRHGAVVGSFPWIDDFAAARNASLDLSTGDWNLVLDADEWLTDGAEDLAAFRRLRPDFLGAVSVASSFGTQGQVDVARLPRILPRGVRYTGRIHEQPDSALPIRPTAVRAGHTGYREEVRVTKARRNRALLEREVAEHPDDAYLVFQLARSRETARTEPDDLAVARDLYLRADELGGPAAPWRHDLILRLVTTLTALGETDAALDVVADARDLWPDSADVHFVVGDAVLAHAEAHPAEAVPLLQIVEASWLRALELGDGHDLPGSVTGRGSFRAAHNLAGLYEVLGDRARAARYRALSTPV